MIDKAILKKHNLKAVPFSAIGEGQTFNTESSIGNYPTSFLRLERRLRCSAIDFSDGTRSCLLADYLCDKTVYVPIWRPC